jgi:hypothetical protein
MKNHRHLVIFKIVVVIISTACFSGAWGAPAVGTNRVFRDGQAKYRDLDLAKLPSGTSPKLFSGEIAGNTFELFVRNLDAQPLTIELGFVDIGSQGQNAFALAANGSPLDANLNVATKAGGTFKPWVMKTAFNHAGGALAVQFSGLGTPAFVSYLRISDANGRELAFGTAKNWEKPERLTLLDSRSRPFHHVKVGEVPFFDVDHSPVGGWATFIYGMENSGGVQVCKQPGGEGTLIPNQGVIIAVKNGTAERLMPFASKQRTLPKEALVTDKEVTRTLGACSDNWKIPMGVSWVHYTPVWAMKDWNTASEMEKRRFVLPVTWMQYRIDNRSGKVETQLLFSLEQSARRAQGLNGFEGYTVAEDSTIAVKAGEAELLSEDQAKADFGVEGATAAFCIHVAPGTEKVITFYIVQYHPGVEAQLESHSLTLMSAALYKDMNDMLKTAADSLPDVISRCVAVDQKLANCGQDDERKFLAADTLHSYQYNTILHATENREPVWAVIEGECSCINTFDLTIDHVFYELAMHPWTVRNELDNFSKIFSYTDELSLPGQTQRFPGGLGFWHDMGSRVNFSNKTKGAAYKTLMTQEELQNWIICAALYWKTTGDNGWLEANKEVFKRALVSMQLRDDLDPAKRDGITTYVSNVGDRSGEITTYDAMDASLQHPQNSLYIAGKSFACYAMLKPVFLQLGEASLAGEVQAAENYTAKGILSHWDASRKFFPALFDGKSDSAIIPAVEGLAYVYAMGLTNDVSLNGPNGELISHLKTHLETILVPGVCLDAQTGAWNLSSTSYTTWVSKVYLNQFVAENVLGVKSAITGHDADAAHYAYEVLGAPAVCWTDQIYTSSHVAYGCRHYPRGVTSALWWLWPLEPSGP